MLPACTTWTWMLGALARAGRLHRKSTACVQASSKIKSLVHHAAGALPDLDWGYNAVGRLAT